jgi:hypothetical protein
MFVIESPQRAAHLWKSRAALRLCIRTMGAAKVVDDVSGQSVQIVRRHSTLTDKTVAFDAVWPPHLSRNAPHTSHLRLHAALPRSAVGARSAETDAERSFKAA